MEKFGENSSHFGTFRVFFFFFFQFLSYFIHFGAFVVFFFDMLVILEIWGIYVILWILGNILVIFSN